MTTNIKNKSRVRRHARIRAKVFGTEARPRLSIFKSNRYVSGQIINDEEGKTVAAFSTKGLKQTGTAASTAAGKELAKLAQEKKIKKVVFDRGGFLYTGVVKAFADGAREGGLEF